MGIGNLITKNRITGSISEVYGGDLFVNGEKEASLFFPYKDIVDTLNKKNVLFDVPFERMKNFLSGSNNEIYSLMVYGFKKNLEGKTHLANVELGKYEPVSIRCSDTSEAFMQTHQVGGQVPITDENGRLILEDICFGEAYLLKEIVRGKQVSYEYPPKQGSIMIKPASAIVGIGKETYRSLAKSIEDKLIEFIKNLEQENEK